MVIVSIITYPRFVPCSGFGSVLVRVRVRVLVWIHSTFNEFALK